ncbi:MAG: KpsF/GutQ family sugar-phosphate isomerase [bacterium]|nr:KpsF/GutQ family sugar-phosphate isomerase [bacterium]
MMKTDIIEKAKEVIRIEGEAVEALADRIDESFIKAVDLMLTCQGKVVITGMGKSGLIGQKIASTLASTGTPAMSLHPAEGIHGDLGMIGDKDLVIAISNSGETTEINSLVPVLKKMGLKIISLVGNKKSYLAGESDVCLDVSVIREACPLGLAPTASTTAALVMGDALAVALLDSRGFTREDFAFLHPGGSLGRRLMLKVKDIMITGGRIPVVSEDVMMEEALVEITGKRLGLTTVIDQEGRLVGMITDGDVRRIVQADRDFYRRKVKDVMSRNPKSIEPDRYAVEAVEMMEKREITSLVIVDEAKKPVGIVHLHDLLGRGEFRFEG